MRKRVNKRIDKRVFKATANKTNIKNSMLGRKHARGGFHL